MRQYLFMVFGFMLGLSLHTWKGEAFGMPIQIERTNPPGTVQPTAYTQLVRAGKTLYLAGQTAVNEKGELIGKGDMRAQVRQVYENLKSLLASQRATFEHLVKITIYTLSIEEFRKAADIRQEYTAGRAPAGTLVQIDQLASPDYLVEIEGIAVLEE